jgi:hypothetical protein
MMTGAPAPRFALSALHLFVLAGFAVAQPLYDLLGRYATFFVAHQAGAADIVAFTVAVSLGVPAALVLFEALVGILSQRLRRGLHLALVAGLAALIVLPPLNRVADLPAVLAALVALAGGGLVALAYGRLPAVRSALTVLGLSVPLFPVLFLLASPVREVIRPPSGAVSQRVAVTKPAPLVVVIVFDELSLFALVDAQGEIDAVRFPNFASLARTSTWHRNATTVSDYTPLAVPAILTGIRPDHNRLPTASEHPRNLFTLLGDAYRLAVVEPVTELCPPDLCARRQRAQKSLGSVVGLLGDAAVIYLHMLAPTELRGSLPDIARQWTFKFQGWFHAQMLQAKHGDRVRVFTEFVRRIESSVAPTLYFAHTLLPHYPYEFLPSGTRYAPPPPTLRSPHADIADLIENLRGAAWVDDPGGAAQEQERYLLQLGMVDRLLADLLDHLHRLDLFDPALLVVTADHGVSFRPGQSQRFVTESNHEDIMWVPLFVKAPGQRQGRVDDRNVETIDILPTIAEVLGVELPWPVDGQSVLRPESDTRPDKSILTPATRSNMLALARITVPAERPHRPPALVNQLQLFGAHRPVADLLRRGPHAEVIGRVPDAASRKARAPFTVELGTPEAYRDVRPRQRPLPAFVHGWVDSDQPPQLAVALNGVVAATTSAFAGAKGRLAFGVLLPEEYFRPGANRVEIFELRGAPGAATLHLIPPASP